MNKTLRKYFAFFALPTLIAFSVAFVIPFAMGALLSFAEFTTVNDARFAGLSNYAKAFSNREFLDALWFTAKFAAVSVVSVNLIAFILAMLLTRGLRGTNVFRTIFFLPNLIGGIVLGYVWQLILNGILARFGVTLTFDPAYGFWGLVLLMNWQLAGYMMIIYIAGIQSIPQELFEASHVDGAGAWGTLKNVILPMLAPSFTICLFLTLTNSFKLFDQNLALTAGEPGKRSSMLALDIYNTFYGRSGWEGVGQAKAVVFFAVTALISFLQLAFTRRKEVSE